MSKQNGGSAPDIAFPTLFSPIRLRGFELRNRIVFAPHGAFQPWNPLDSGDQFIEYQRQRAAGGIAMSNLQPLFVEPDFDPAIFSERMARLADAVHGEGAYCVLQLVNFGGQMSAAYNFGGRPLWSFNGMQAPNGEVSHRMSGDEIQRMVDAYIRAARVATEAGIDGVELHGTHGYLIQQSFSPWGNDREDEWGEPLAFTRALIAGVRAAIAPEKMIGFRMAAEDDHPPEAGGLSLDRLCELARDIADTGEIDFMNTSIGAYSPDYAAVAVATYRQVPGHELHLTTRLRQAVGGKVPVIGVGRITTPELAEKALADGACDLVGLARALISDAAFPEKSRTGASSSIRRCVGANDCVDRKLGGINIGCFHNPDVGREAVAGIEPAEHKKRILIIGAGPAGLKAAEVSALLGHEVIIVERDAEAGGTLRHLRDTKADSLVHATDWLVRRLEHHQITIRFGTEADLDLIEEVNADHVIFATGACRPVATAFPGVPGGRVLSSVDALNAPMSGRVLVLDRLGNKEGAQIAEVALARGCSVEFVTPFDSVAPRAGYTHRKAIGLAFRSGGVKVRLEMDIAGFEDGQALLRDVDGRAQGRLEADQVVAVIAPVAEAGLAGQVKARGLPCSVIGDAAAPRGVLDAMREADALARSL